MKLSKNEIMSQLYDCENGKYAKKISGWWKDSVFDIYEAFDLVQERLKIEGNLCEIGTWHGRSFLALRNFTKDHETCIGIDIFKGHYYDDLINNIKKCFGTLSGSEIIKITQTSTTTDKYDALKPYTPIRIFYIDGNHTYDGTLLDLNVAKLALHEDGIVFLDDYENPRYGPAIVNAVNKFLDENEKFTLAFSSTQRVFLCQAHMVDHYVSAMSELNWNVDKDVIWSNLISFNHPHGDNSWQTTKRLEHVSL